MCRIRKPLKVSAEGVIDLLIGRRFETSLSIPVLPPNGAPRGACPLMFLAWWPCVLENDNSTLEC